VTPEWNVLRIATFYGPVWLFIVMNVFIYVKVGMVVFKWRQQLISLDKTPSNARPQFSMQDAEPHARPALYEVQITSQVPHDPIRSKRGSQHRTQFENELRSPTIPNTYRTSHSPHPSQDAPPRRIATIRHPSRLDANKATITYCFTALLFFIALLVTWVPSTINRLYTLIKPNSTSPFGLDFSSSLVLPLQGFWNFVIYAYTSRAACKLLFEDAKARLRSQRSESSNFELPRPGRRKHGSQPLGSTDTRADVIISIDGKSRVVHHRSHDSFMSFENDNDTVPEIVSPTRTMPKVPHYDGHSSFTSDATTANDAHRTNFSPHSKRGNFSSNRSSNRSSHPDEYPRRPNRESDGSQLSFAR
jgi:hypothetical protein